MDSLYFSNFGDRLPTLTGRRLITARAGTELLYAELVHPVLMVQLGSGPDAGLRRTTLVGGKPPTRGPAKANNKRYG